MAQHTVMAGPNSIGQWSHDICAVGGSSFPPYFLTDRHCEGFRFSVWNTIRSALAENGGKK
jgi:hypothetical protein